LDAAPGELISRTLISFSERREILELVLRMKGLLVDRHEVEGGPTLAFERSLSLPRHRRSGKALRSRQDAP